MVRITSDGIINVSTDVQIKGKSLKTLGYLCRKHSGTQSLTNTTISSVLFDTIQFSSSTAGLSYDTISGKFTNNTTTKNIYTISTTIAFANNSTGRRYLWFQLNTIIPAVSTRYGQICTDTVTGDGTVLSTSLIIMLDPGEYFNVVCFQNSGGALNIGTGAGFTGSCITITAIPA